MKAAKEQFFNSPLQVSDDGTRQPRSVNRLNSWRSKTFREPVAFR